MKPRLLIAESTDFSRVARERLDAVADVVAADLDRVGLLAAVGTADVLWIRLRHKIDEQVFAAAPSLRLIASPTTGLDHIDLAAAARRGISVISLRDAQDFLKDVRATAELTIALMLSLLRHIPAATRHVQAGHWNRDAFKGSELRGKTIGIVGYGRLGRLVAGYVQAFGAAVVASDPHVSSADVELVPLADLMRRADIISLHVSLSDATRGMFGAAELAQMKRGSWLVNTSRGELVDDAALLDAQRTQQLAGAALDVVRGESSTGVGELPLVAYARTHDNLIITPHIGGCTYESMAATENYLAERVCAALQETR
jgi:D-3-phosphoglycerate dehydrogenase